MILTVVLEVFFGFRIAYITCRGNNSITYTTN